MNVIGCRLFDIILLTIPMERKLGSTVADESENTTRSISKENDYTQCNSLKLINVITNVHEREVSMEQGSTEFEFRKSGKCVTTRM